jgi:hypothetical protein
VIYQLKISELQREHKNLHSGSQKMYSTAFIFNIWSGEKIKYGKTLPEKVAEDSMRNLLKLKLVTSQ